jgi:uncharacterized membrane protein
LNGAVVIRFHLFCHLLAILVFFLVFQEANLRGISLDSIAISKQNYLNSLLMVYSLGSFAIFLVDLIYLPFANFAMYIGAIGLMDGIFLSGLFSIFTLTIVVALFGIVLEEKRKMVYPLHRKKYEDLKKQIPELAVTIVFMGIFLYCVLVITPSLNPNDRMHFGAFLIALIIVFAFAYSAIKKHAESRKQRKLDRYLS